MEAKLIVQINEVVIRDYSLIEDEGLGNLVAGCENIRCPGISQTYEEDEETGKNMIVITGPDLPTILKFLDFAEIPVKILT